MSDFEFVFSLFALLLGLALAEVLGGLGTAIQARKTVRIGWLTPLLGLIVALDLTSFWIAAWDIRDSIPTHYLSLMCGLVVTGLYYLVARLVFPNDIAEWPDYDSYYFAHKKLVFGGILLCNLLAMAGQIATGYRPFGSALSAAGTTIFFALLLIAIWLPGRGANLVLLALLAALYPLFAVLFLLAG